MARPGESDEEFARRLAMEEGTGGAPRGLAVPVVPHVMAHGQYPSSGSFAIAQGVPVATVAVPPPSHGGGITGVDTDGSGGGGEAFGRPTVVQVAGQPVHIVGGGAVPAGSSLGYPSAVAIVDTGDQRGRRLRNNRLLPVFQLSRSVKLFSLLDIFFLVLWGLTLPVLLLAIVLPALGYWGAKTFSQGPVWCYIVFIIAHIIGRIAYIGWAADMMMWVVFVNLMGIMVEAYILRIVFAFVQLLRTCTPQELHDLREVSQLATW